MFESTTLRFYDKNELTGPSILIIVYRLSWRQGGGWHLNASYITISKITFNLDIESKNVFLNLIKVSKVCIHCKQERQNT